MGPPVVTTKAGEHPRGRECGEARGESITWGKQRRKDGAGSASAWRGEDELEAIIFLQGCLSARRASQVRLVEVNTPVVRQRGRTAGRANVGKGGSH